MAKVRSHSITAATSVLTETPSVKRKVKGGPGKPASDTVEISSVAKEKRKLKPYAERDMQAATPEGLAAALAHAQRYMR